MGFMSVLIWLDSISGDYFLELYERGELPNLSEYFEDGALAESVMASYPTVSEAAEGSLITGLFSGEVNMVGERYFSRTSATVMHYKFNADIKRDFPKELADYTIDKFSGRSLGLGRLIPVNTEIIRDPIADEYERKGSLKLVERRMSVAMKLLKERRPKLFLFTVSADYASHVSGRKGTMVRDILRIFDELFPELIKVLKNVNPKHSVFIFSDHGSKEVTKHLDLTQLLTEYGLNPADPGTLNPQVDCNSAAISNGRRMGMIYVKHPEKGWVKVRAKLLKNFPLGGGRLDLIELLSQEEGIGLVIYRDEEGHVIIKSDEGEGVISYNGEKYKYSVTKGQDPICYEEGVYNRWMSEEEWLKATYDKEFPDAVIQLFNVFKANNCGDIVLNPAEGWDFWESWGIHYPRLVASHGGLSREEMRVFILAKGPRIKKGRIPYSRILDIYATLSNYYIGKTIGTHSVERFLS